MHAKLARLAQDVVVNVGDIAHAQGAVAEVTQPPLEYVVNQVDRRVTEMGRVVGRDPAGVHRDDLARRERDNLTTSCVV